MGHMIHVSATLILEASYGTQKRRRASSACGRLKRAGAGRASHHKTLTWFPRICPMITKILSPATTWCVLKPWITGCHGWRPSWIAGGLTNNGARAPRSWWDRLVRHPLSWLFCLILHIVVESLGEKDVSEHIFSDSWRVKASLEAAITVDISYGTLARDTSQACEDHTGTSQLCGASQGLQASCDGKTNGLLSLDMELGSGQQYPWAFPGPPGNPPPLLRYRKPKLRSYGNQGAAEKRLALAVQWPRFDYPGPWEGKSQSVVILERTYRARKGTRRYREL